MATAAATTQLPQELITEILTLLPVKSIKRFRSLSKPLCARIDSPQFIDSHFSKSSQNFNLRKLIFQDKSRMKFHVCDVSLDMEGEVLRLENPVSSPWRIVRGYCKGLLLLDRGEFKLALWNPSTRQFRDLPVCPLGRLANVVVSTKIGFGLCYDENIDDYKVFLIVHIERKVRPKFEAQVWIYGLKSNRWRRSRNWDFPHHLFMEDIAAYLLPKMGYFIPADGVIYWVATTCSYEHEIVAFDVRKETFSILPSPDCSLISDSEKRDIEPPVSTALHVLEGCLCISYFHMLQADLYIRRKDERGQFTWTQLFSITDVLFVFGLLLKPLRVVGCSKRGDKILLDLGHNYLVSYDLKGECLREVEIDKDFNWMSPVLCVESLAPVAGGA